MLIVVDMTRTLPTEITVMDLNGKQFRQLVVTYNWKPEFCEKCQVVGHKCHPPRRIDNCQLRKRKIVQQWKNQGPIKLDATKVTAEKQNIIQEIHPRSPQKQKDKQQTSAVTHEWRKNKV